MPPKPDVQTRDKTKKLGISYDWKRFGQGGGIEVTRSNSQLEETEGQNKDDDNILPEVRAQTEEITSAENTENELEWDHSEDTSSPPKETSDLYEDSQEENEDDNRSLVSQTNSNEQSIASGDWSTINLFNTEVGTVGVFSPQIQTGQEGVPRSNRLNAVASPALDTIAETDQHSISNEVFQQPELILEHRPIAIEIMDEAAYKRRSVEIGDALRGVEDAIFDFGPSQVHSGNLEDCEGSLSSIKEKFVNFRTTLRAFYGEFDRVEHAVWKI